MCTSFDSGGQNVASNFFSYTRPPVHRNSTILSVYFQSMPRLSDEPILLVDPEQKGSRSFSLFHSSFLILHFLDFSLAVVSYLTSKSEREEEKMWRGVVKDGSCYDGGPRDGRTLMPRPAVPRRFASHLVGSSDVICDVECRRRYEIQIRPHGLHTSN